MIEVAREKRRTETVVFFEASVDGRVVATIEPRPSYCDRGHWLLKVDLPGVDVQDGFPRYFMNVTRAMDEATDFLRWRLRTISSGGSNEEVVQGTDADGGR